MLRLISDQISLHPSNVLDLCLLKLPILEAHRTCALIVNLTRCKTMMSLSVNFSPFIGSTMSFLISFSTHSRVTTEPLEEEEEERLSLLHIKCKTDSHASMQLEISSDSLLVNSFPHSRKVPSHYSRWTEHSTRDRVSKHVSCDSTYIAVLPVD